jgi:predicted HicB family RNase H-like nuclease
MSTLTIRIPETKHARLRLLARNRGLSMNKLMDELATVALLDKLDRRFRLRKTTGR